jgi:hypothetical protein
MNRQAAANGSEEVAQLGEPSLVCRTSRKTLVWSFVLASSPIGFGIAVLLFVVKALLADWSRDIFGSILLLAVGVVSLWGGRALWRKANRLRHVKVAVHAGGLSYRDGGTCLTCRWDQIEEVRWRVSDHYEEHSCGLRSCSHPRHEYSELQSYHESRHGPAERWRADGFHGRAPEHRRIGAGHSRRSQPEHRLHVAQPSRAVEALSGRAVNPGRGPAL